MDIEDFVNSNLVESLDLLGQILVVNVSLDEAHEERLKRVCHIRLALLFSDALQVGLVLSPHRMRHKVVLPSKMTQGRVRAEIT